MGGKIKIVESNGAVLSTPFLQIPANRLIDTEYNGIFSLAFHPNFSSNGYFYVFYNQKEGPGVVARFTRNSSNPNVADFSSEFVLLTIPYPDKGHRGGRILFGPDGYLYIFTGDDGNVGRGQIGDVLGNAQNLQKKYGKILRIDVNSSSPYGIPPTNPYLIPGDGIPDEIWASGLRNPWRASFDRQTGDLWLGDNGQDGYEEVDFVAANGSKVVPAGQNFGWRCYEGTHAYVTAGCNWSGSFVTPLHEYAGYTNNGNREASVLGGFVYRGNASPSLKGWYVYGDYSQGKLYVLNRRENNTYQHIQQTPTLVNPVSFGEGYDGELYVVTFNEGKLYRISATDAPGSQNRPPVAPSMASLTGTVGKVFAITLPAFTDPDNNPLTYEITGSVPGLTFDKNTRIISGTPTLPGQYSLTYAASDGIAKVSVSVTVTIAPAAVVSGDFEGYLSTVDCGIFSGWVWDRNKPNTPLTVEFLDGATLANATLVGQMDANQFRQDLLTAGKGNGNHGYRYTPPESLKNNQKHTIWARVQGTGYVLKQAPKDLTCAGTAPPNPNPPTPPANQKPVAPTVAALSGIKGTGLTTTLPSFSDPDTSPAVLTHSLSGLPDGLLFTATSRVISGTPTTTGTFSLTYSASDGKDITTTTVLLSIANPPSTTLVTGDFEGYLDKVECGTIRGWVWDRGKPNASFTLEFYTGNTVWGTTVANIYRQDLKNAGKGNGAHAYSFEVPKTLKDGTRRAISARIQGSNYVLKDSGKSLICPSGSRISAEELQVIVLGNPVSEAINVEVRGAEDQPLQLILMDSQGKIIRQRLVEKAASQEHHQFDVSHQVSALLLLRVSTPLQTKTLKILKSS